MSLERMNSEDLKGGIPQEIFRGREYYCPNCSDSGRQEKRTYQGDKEFKIGVESVRKGISFHANHYDYLFHQVALQDFLKKIPMVKKEDGYVFDEWNASDIQRSIFHRMKKDSKDYLQILTSNLFLGEKRYKEMEFILRNSENWMTYSAKFSRKLENCNCKRGIALSLSSPPKQVEDGRK